MGIKGMRKDSLVFEKACRFAVRVVKAYQYLSKEKQEYVLSRQLLRCGTSIGANVAEANGAISNADFSSKISIAYKESLETKYWLTLLKDTAFLAMRQYESLYRDADEISRMLFAILKTSRISNQ